MLHRLVVEAKIPLMMEPKIEIVPAMIALICIAIVLGFVGLHGVTLPCFIIGSGSLDAIANELQ